jgi:hypothetical protein
MDGKEQASRWKRFLCFVFGHDMVETSRMMHSDRDIVTNTCERCGKTESPI